MQIEITDLERAELQISVYLELERIERRIEDKIPNASHLSQDEKDRLLEHWTKKQETYKNLVDKLMPR